MGEGLAAISDAGSVGVAADEEGGAGTICGAGAGSEVTGLRSTGEVAAISLDAVDAGGVAAGVVSDAAGVGAEEDAVAISCVAGPGCDTTSMGWTGPGTAI